MKIQNLIRTAAVATLLFAPAVQAENLDIVMSQVFPQDHATYIGYESVEREDVPVSAAVERKYLLKDRELVRSLSDSGYDMVSVAFDRRSQFDCL